MKTCKVKDCDVNYSKRGLCNKHYLRFIRHGSTDKRVKPVRLCSIDGCNNKHKAYGLCRKHHKEKFKERFSAQNHEYYLKNREKCLTYGKNRRLENPEYEIERHRKYRKKNKEKLCLANNTYRKTIKGRMVIKASSHKRRDRTIDLTTKTIQLIYEDNIKKHGTLTCILCNKPIEFGQDSLEHKTPLSRGGDNNYNNLGVAHQSCNSQKHTQTTEEWFAAKAKNKRKLYTAP